MIKTITYIVLFGMLAFGSWYFFHNQNETLFTASEVGFTIKDTAHVGKIFIAKRNGESITLSRNSNGWIVNNQFAAAPVYVSRILATLKDQTAVEPVPQLEVDRILKLMAGTAIKVEVYNLEGQKMAVFYVGNEAPNYSGTYFLAEGAKAPYIVQIPNFSGYLTPRYSTNIAAWRDQNIINLKANEIKSVYVQYQEHPTNSFTLTRTNDSNVSVSLDSIFTIGKTLNKKRTLSYLNFFENLACEQFCNHLPGLDTAINVKRKRALISIVNKNNQQQQIEVYYMPISSRSKNLGFDDNPDYNPNYDIDRCYALINNFKDTVCIQNKTFNKILRRAYEFYTPDETK